MAYEVMWRAVASDHFRKLDKPAQQLVASKVDQLPENPRPATVKALVGMTGVLRLRAGDYRVLYTVDDDSLQIWIEDVRHRSKVYGGH
jgi:mRNA interferase RelE/StbE